MKLLVDLGLKFNLHLTEEDKPCVGICQYLKTKNMQQRRRFSKSRVVNPVRHLRPEIPNTNEVNKIFQLLQICSHRIEIVMK